MNLDLNLGPFVYSPHDDQPHNMTLEDLLHVGPIPPSHHHLPPVWRHIPVPMVIRNPTLGLAASGAPASFAHDDIEKPQDKTNENGDEGSFFDCNICLDLASDPVVTCCGHLFCWPCIYRWLFVHSSSKQCPICKGEVTMKTITPIYSRVNRVNCTHVTKVLDPKSLKIPSRPLANRVESWRHSFQRDALNSPVIEMVRRMDNNRFHLSRDPLSSNPLENPSTLLLNRIFTSRGIRGHDSVHIASPDVTVDLRHLSADRISDLMSAESFLDSYNRDHPDETHSMTGVNIMPSEVVTAGTDSGRRRDPSTTRVWDGDSGNSRRRRLH